MLVEWLVVQVVIVPVAAAWAVDTVNVRSRTMRVFTSVGLILCILAVLLLPVRGDDEKEDFDALIKVIQNGDKKACLNALGELRDMGSCGKPAVGAILRRLRHKDEKIRGAAAEALAEIGPGVEAIPALIEAMKDEETGGDAAWALVAVGPAAIPALTRALHESDDNIRSNAVYALGEFGSAAKDSMPELRALFAKELAEGRADIANTWAEIGSGARSAVPLLVESLRDRSLELRFAAARALWQIEGRPERVVPTLIAIVESKETVEKAADRSDSRAESPRSIYAAYAAKLLGKIGPEAREAVAALMEAMKARDNVLCDCSIEALGEIGPDAKQAIPAIVERLGDHREAKALGEPHHWTYAGTWHVGITAWSALGKMGPDAAVGLIPALNHQDKEVRQQAALALKELGPLALPALDALVASLRDSEDEVRQYAACALGGIGSAAQSALPALLKAVQDPSSRVREEAVDALPLVAPKSSEVVATLIAALADSDGTVQAHAAMSLGKLGAAARGAVPLLAKMLSSQNEYLTSGHPVMSRPLADCIASVLGDLGPVAKEAVPALVEAARKTRNINWQAIPAIGKIGPDAKAAVPFLLQDSTPEAAIAIAQVDPDNTEILPILREAWQSADRLQPRPEIYPDRSWCYVLGRFGLRVKPAIPTLEELLDIPNCRCRMAVALTVLEIDPTHKQALDACVDALRERSHGFPEVGPVVMGDFLESAVEERLDQLMVRLGPCARAFVPTLCEVLENPGLSARISAAERLAAIGFEAEGAVPSLIQALGRRNPVFPPDEDLPGKAAEALARIGSAAVSPLIKALKDEHYLIRAGAADALGRIGPAAASAIAALAEALRDERMIVRASAAKALGRMGETAAPAVPALARALRDDYCLVRRNAAEALGEIGPAAQDATRAVVDTTSDEYLFVREVAQATLRKIRVQSAPQQ